MKRIINFLLVLLVSFAGTARAQFKFLPDERSRRSTGPDIQSVSGWPFAMPADVEVPEWDDAKGRSTGFPYTADYEYKSLVDIVTIGVDHYKRDIVAAFRYKVSVTIDYKVAKPGGGGFTTSAQTTELYLSYDPDSLKKYNDLSTFKFNGAHAFKATITGIQKVDPVTGALTPLSRADIAANFFIETKIYSQRYDKKKLYLNAAACEPNTDLSKLYVSCFFHIFASGGDPATGTIAYKPVVYELEWTYVDDYVYNTSDGTMEYGFKSGSIRPVTYDFRKNSTRVQLDAPFYAIPLVYEHGAIVFRFRSVRPKLSDYEQIVYGDWTLEDNGSLSLMGSDFDKHAYLITKPHTYDKLNWQYTINFAEQGKHKEVINYFDGSLKDRQTQTMINSNAGKIIAVDKVYDFEGRPSIVSLPTPVDQSGLYYRGDILTNVTSGKAYKAEDFDGPGCSRPGEIPVLSNGAAANIYYSPLNPDKAGMQKFVPDAEGYPLVHTVYSPDNTNKVEWQGGAGKEQQLVKGHGTHYEYVRATQPELDKFLGAEVGYDRFYPKQIVTDPNGQSSYSILNPQGKVVVSGLQSESPDNAVKPIEPLSNFVAGSEVCNDLLKNAEQDKLRDGLEFYTTYYNDGLGRNTLSYSVKTFPYATGCSGQYLWTTGNYTVDVTDDCGAPYSLLSTSGQVKNNLIVTSPGATKTTDAAHGSGFAYTATSPVLIDPSVPQGKILINKKITFSEYDIRNQVRGFVKANEPVCFNPEEFFVRKAVEETEFPCGKEEATQGDPGNCDGLRQQMIDELFPNAKYGKYQYFDSGRHFAGQKENSIFTIVEEVDPAATTGRMDGRTPQCGIKGCNISGPCDGGVQGCACTDKHIYPFRCCDDCVLKECACISFPIVVTPGTTVTSTTSEQCINLPGVEWVYASGLGFSDDFPSPHQRDSYTGELYTPDGDDGTIIFPYGTYYYHWKAGLIRCNCGYVEDTLWRKFYTKYPPYITGTGIVFEPAIATFDPDHGPFISGTHHDCPVQHVTATYTDVPAVKAYYRYQSECINYPEVVYNGKVYTSEDIRKADPQTFINMFTREMAEALLVLHPEYCKLLNCQLTSGTFEQTFAALSTYQEAEVAGMYTLDDIVDKDPFPKFLNNGAAPTDPQKFLLKYPYQLEAAQLGSYPLPVPGVDFENLPGLRLDIQAMAHLYCGAGNATEMVNCALNKYSAEIQASPVYLTDPLLKQRYFKELQAKYLGNRSTIKQAYLDHRNSTGGCAPCAGQRMNLIGEPLFKGILNYFDMDGDGITEVIEEDEDFGKLPKWKKDLYLGLSDEIPAEFLDEYNAQKEQVALAEAETIMEALKNCTISDRVALQELLKNKILAGEKMTPDLIKSSIIAASPDGAAALNDLCHPFLVAYGLFPDAKKVVDENANFACSDPALYTGLQNFLDRTEIKDIIAAAPEGPTDPDSYTTISVSRGGVFPGNAFENKFMDQFGYPWPGTATTHDLTVTAASKQLLPSCAASCARYIELTISSGTMAPDIKLNIFNANAPETNNDLKSFISGAATPYVWFQNGMCINDDPKADRFGLIAQKTASVEAAFQTMILGSPVTIKSKFFVWCNELDLMTPAPGVSDFSDAVNCKDINDALLAFKGGDKTLYGYSDDAGHPFYEKILTNYLNFTFGQQFSYPQYRALMEGCALSDQVFFSREVAHARIELITDAAADAFETQINSLGTFKPRLFRYKPNGSSRPVVFVDLSPINEKDVPRYMRYLMMTAPDVFLPPISGLFSTTAHYVPPANMLFTATGCTFTASAFPAGMANYTSSTVQVWENGAYTNYTLHEFGSAAGTPTPLQKAAVIAIADNYRNGSSGGDACKAAYAFYNTDYVRSADYNTPFKQAYLQYMQGLGSVSRTSFLASVSPATLTSALPGYYGNSFTYNNPYCTGTRNHLFMYKPAPTAVEAPGYDLVKNTILSNVTSGGDKLFPDADLTYKATAPTGFDQQLAIIRKANGTFWYRFFDNTSNKLYNLYLAPPDKKLARKPADYVFSAIEMGPDPNTFIVTVNATAVAGYWTGSVYTPPLPAVTARCTGYADFSLAGTSMFASNVMLQKSSGNGDCFDSLDCEKDLLTTAILNGKTAYYQYFEANVATISKDYMNHLVNTTRDTLIYCGRRQQYQQTLYYYDRAGNLVRTVPPAGIVPLGDMTVGIPGGYTYGTPDVEKYRDNPAQYLPDHFGLPLSGINPKLTRHKKVSSYKYSSLNQLVWQQTPDGGVTTFFYDAAGRQIFSQNTEQRMGGYYTYNLYDEQGRPKESGEIRFGDRIPEDAADPDNTPYIVSYRTRTPGPAGEVSYSALHPDFIANSSDGQTYPYADLEFFVHAKPRRDVVLTTYDEMTEDLGAIAGEMLSTQENLRGRVAAIRYLDNLPPDWASLPIERTKFSTFYSYDIGGNVKTITYDFSLLQYDYNDRYKRVDYDYDLISGKVNMISYNRGHPDQFYQQYSYDDDNRITEVSTSNDGLVWNKDARYEYYKHGPLAALKLGEHEVQSLEYAYTIQGWLKAINGDVLNATKDMGGNGLSGDATYPRDVIAHALRYFSNDYKPIGSTPVTNITDPTAKNLYNGNISQQTTGIGGLGTLQRVYSYDQLQRLKLATNGRVDDAALTASTTPANLYKSTYSYDKDGNISSLQRWDGNTGTPVQIDNFSYNYEATAANNNKLLQVSENPATPTGGEDLQPGQPADNYSYDRIGNLLRDKQGAEHIRWDRFGKVLSIYDSSIGTKRYTTFAYDGRGNRIFKETSVPLPGGTSGQTDKKGEYYVRDAGGNILAVYRTHSVYDRYARLRTAVLLGSGTVSPADPSGTVLTDVLTGYTTTSIATGLRGVVLNSHSGWVDTYTDRPIGFYWSADPTLRSTLLYSGTAWIDGLRDHAPQVYSDALLRSGPAVQPLFFSALDFQAEGRKLLEHFSEQMPPPVCQPIWNMGQAQYIPGNHAVNGNSLYNSMMGPMKPALINEMLQQLDQNYHQGGMEATAFYSAVVADNTIWMSPALRGQNGPWTTDLTQIVNMQADDHDLLSFFETWGGGAGAFATAVTPDYKLGAVYDADPYTATRDMCLTATTDEIAGVLDAIPTITYYGLKSGLVNAGVALETFDASEYYASSGDTLALAEHHIYGSSRLGVQRYDSVTIANIIHLPEEAAANQRSSLHNKVPWYSYGFADVIDSTQRSPYAPDLDGNAYTGVWYTNRTLGRRMYELTDHLGNVLATVLDRKTGATATGEAPVIGGLYDHWHADIAQASDYYPGGMIMPGRYKQYDWSRMGFGGEAKDDEIYGKGNFVNYAERQYDPRLLRWPTVDKLFAKYPGSSPYAFVGNSPIMNKEIDGRDYSMYVNHDSKTIIIKATYYTAKGDVVSGSSAQRETQFWNNASGKYQYVISKGNEKIVYDVVFDLNTQEVDRPNQQVGYDRLSTSEAQMIGVEQLNTTMSSNSYSIASDDATVFKGVNEAGVTIDGSSVNVKNSYKDASTGAHEIGHSLGIRHRNEGLMTPALEDTKQSKTVSPEDVQQIIHNAIKKDPEGGGKGVIRETGIPKVSEKSFKKGEVYEKTAK